LAGEALYVGRVMHARLKPFRHRFAYRVFTCLFDVDEIPSLAARLRLLAHNRFGLFSFHDRDHGPRDGSPLRPWVERRLAEAGIAIGRGRIELLCFPRLLGYVFNPLSIFFCRDESGRLAAIVYEVKNTFGDQHAYVLPAGARQDPSQPVTHQTDKTFYVSPFIHMECTYRFRLTEPGDRLAVLIRQTDAAGELLVATLTGTRRALDDRSLALAFLRHPLMTLKVIAAIHWEALRLWVKGARLVPRPQPNAALPPPGTPVA
jgi:DUF1365 family protein